MENLIRFAEMIKESNNIVFFGGAGVSTESGVKDYRSEDGLYNTVKDYGAPPENILSRTFLSRNPQVFYAFFRKYFTIDVEPNNAHKALCELEKRGKLSAVITQNVDGLHQKAGSNNVIELHGTANEFYCFSCGKKPDNKEVLKLIKEGYLPRCKSCGVLLKPNVVLYEESLKADVIEKAIDTISNADMLIIGGTSLVVEPAASFVRYFEGKYTVMINTTETEYDGNADLIIRDKIGEVFEKVMKEL